jgi:hypothetical protein
LGIRGMNQLEEFDCGVLSDDCEASLLRVTQALAQCRNLKIMKLYFCSLETTSLRTELDQALTDCIASVKNQLVEIHICCEPLRQADMTQVSELPVLLEALKSDYSIQRVNQHTRSDLYEPMVDPWDPILKKSLEIIPKLNAAGRNYLASDSTNRMAGFKVLEQVNDDLDCLFYHIRENLLLCVRQKWTAATKRKVGQYLGQV